MSNIICLMIGLNCPSTQSMYLLPFSLSYVPHLLFTNKLFHSQSKYDLMLTLKNCLHSKIFFFIYFLYFFLSKVFISQQNGQCPWCTTLSNLYDLKSDIILHSSSCLFACFKLAFQSTLRFLYLALSLLFILPLSTTYMSININTLY